MNFNDYDPIWITGWVGHEEHDTIELFEIDNKFYLRYSSHNVYMRDINDTTEEISLEKAVEFLNEPPQEFEF